jgi:magnesium transporter
MTENRFAVEDSAHWHLATSVPVAAPDATVGEILAAMRGVHFDCADPVVVIDAKRRVLGRIPLGRLIEVPSESTAEQVMQPEPPSVRRRTDQERVASLALQHDVTAVTVVDEDDRLIGVVPAQALLGILRREHIEDLHRLAGIVREEANVREAMEAPPARRARHRLPWLLLGLAGSVLAAFVMKQFEGILSANVAVAFFVPGIVYLADAIGTQTETITVRGLSLSHARIGRMLAGEMRTGLLIGGLLGGAALGAAWLMLDQPRLAVAVGLALFAAGGIATTIGLALPWLLHRIGRDPAYGSGPLATIIQDVLTVTIYFLVVSALAA